MTNEQMPPMSVTYGSAAGVFDPGTELIKISVNGEPITLAVDAVVDNPHLISDFGPDEAYVIGWLASHIVHQRTILNWIATGVLKVNWLDGTNNEKISELKH